MPWFPLKKSNSGDDEQNAFTSPTGMHSRGIGWSQERLCCGPQRKQEILPSIGREEYQQLIPLPVPTHPHPPPPRFSIPLI